MRDWLYRLRSGCCPPWCRSPYIWMVLLGSLLAIFLIPPVVWIFLIAVALIVLGVLSWLTC